MNRTRIEWVKNPDGTQGYSWNPIRGLCPVDCKLPDGKSYCYARKMYQNPFYGWDQKVRIAEIKSAPKKPSKIFVCSTLELFHPVVSKKQRDIIFRFIEDCPQHTFQVLTKMPENIDRKMPDNVWLGVSVTNQEDANRRIPLLFETKARLKFISIEPMLAPIDLSRLICYNPMYEDKYINGKSSNKGDSKGCIRGRFLRKNMAIKEARLGSVGKKSNRETMSSSASRKQNGSRIFTGKVYDTQEKGECIGSQNSLPNINGEDTERNVDKSQERKQGRQSSSKSRIDNTITEHSTCKKNTQSRSVGSRRRKEQHAQTIYGRSKRYPETSGAVSCGSKNQAREGGVYADEEIQCFSRHDIQDFKKKSLAFNLVIIGRLTGHGHKYDPDINWVKDIVRLCAELGVKVFLKNNLKSIWGENLIQEFPGE